MEPVVPLRSFLEIPYDELEQMNLRAYEKFKTASPAQLEKEYREYLKKEKRLKAVTLCFTDIEGRFHMLDYDKTFFLGSSSNLTFDGSSIRGFSMQHESDLRLEVDWTSIRWLPSDIFGPGKVIMFARVLNRDRSPYEADFRTMLELYTIEIKKKHRIAAFAAAEVEGFLVEGVNAEEDFDEKTGFKFMSSSGYYHSLPLDQLRMFIDRAAEAQRAMGFRNEKDHPEVAPSQFELNFSYAEVLRACDNIQLYKLTCRQVANNMGMTATFLPKPIANINGSGMHLNISFQKNGKNIFYDAKGKDSMSNVAWDMVHRVLNHAPELCLLLNASVNSYRRLDPHFEAPNQIKVSSIDRGSMIRIPIGNEHSARLEIRSVGPDANPYLALYALIKTAFIGKSLKPSKDKRARVRFLPDNIYDAMKLFKSTDYTDKLMGSEAKAKYLHFKQMSAERCAKSLGARVKSPEVLYHHEVTNQLLWNRF